MPKPITLEILGAEVVPGSIRDHKDGGWGFGFVCMQNQGPAVLALSTVKGMELKITIEARPAKTFGNQEPEGQDL